MRLPYWDWFDSDYYDYSPASDPMGAVTGTGKLDRGGSWNYYESPGEVWARHACGTNTYDWGRVGFRLARTLTE